MTYHIALFQNSSTGNVVTANPVAQRDTYFIVPKGGQNPDHNVEINYGDWTSYGAAFPKANFIHTGTQSYCFWDSGSSQIFAIAEQRPNEVQALYAGSAGDLELTVQSDGTISFAKAS
jgi:hypothetical protein